MLYWAGPEIAAAAAAEAAALADSAALASLLAAEAALLIGRALMTALTLLGRAAVSCAGDADICRALSQCSASPPVLMIYKWLCSALAQHVLMMCLFLHT